LEVDGRFVVENVDTHQMYTATLRAVPTELATVNLVGYYNGAR
jgi:hypothetical protein